MKLVLETPFKEKWKFGYLVTNSDNRKHVILYNSKTDRSTVSYARYLMSVKEGRMLDRKEQVDHINEDKTDDRIENLQILSCRDNIRKNLKHLGKLGESFLNFLCPVCGVNFKLSKRQSHKINPTCSRKCGYIKGQLNRKRVRS